MRASPLTFSFPSPVRAPASPRPGSDGNLDAVVSREGAANDLLKNDGGGGFTKIAGGAGNPIAAATTTKTKATAWCDFNNDGYLDLAVANDGAANEIHINDKDGTFTKNTHANNKVPTTEATWSTLAIACGDLDGASLCPQASAAAARH